MDFQSIADALSTIQATGSTLAKQSLLKCYGETLPGFKDVLKFIYDPYFVTGLKQAKLDAASISYDVLSVEQVMNYFKTCNTGTAADAQLANSFIYQSDDPNWQWAATGLVTKDLQIGVSVTTLNAVFGGDFIPRIGIMRGMLCPTDWEGYGIATEKIDGNRRLFFNEADGVKTYTRSGKPDKGLLEIESEIWAFLPKGYVYDCECVATGSYGDNIELRQASASILNRRNQMRTGVRALCFDMLPIEHYVVGKSKINALGRKTMLAAIIGDKESGSKLVAFANERDEELERCGKQSKLGPSVAALFMQFYRPDNVNLQHFKALPILGIAQSYDEGVELAKPIWDVKGEGVMLVEWQSPYEVNPNPRKTLLKIKMLKEYVATVTDVYEGDNKYTGMMGGITVNWNGAVFGVGTGFTDADRQYLWEHPETIVGKQVELESFGESQNKQGGRALNCPVFKRIVGDND